MREKAPGRSQTKTRRRLQIADSERDHVVGRIARQRSVEVWEAAHTHAFDRVLGLQFQLALGQAALQRALVAEHQQDALLAGDFAQPLAIGSPLRRTYVLSSKNIMPTTSTPWRPSSSCGRIILPSL